MADIKGDRAATRGIWGGEAVCANAAGTQGSSSGSSTGVKTLSPLPLWEGEDSSVPLTPYPQPPPVQRDQPLPMPFRGRLVVTPALRKGEAVMHGRDTFPARPDCPSFSNNPRSSATIGSGASSSCSAQAM